MEKALGKINAVSQKDGKYGMQINGDWYNGFGNAPAKKGDEVEVEFEMNGNFRNPKKVSIVKPASTTTEIRSDVNASQLTSYAKDLVIAMMNKPAKKEILAGAKVAENEFSLPETMKVATQCIIEAYSEIKKTI